MIGYLKGKFITTIGQQIVLEVNGIGYRVFTNPKLLFTNTGEDMTLYIFHKISEDSQTLFGFTNLEDLKFFELLLTVSGVGPKTALGIISSTSLDILTNAISSEDAAFFSKMGGIGKKTAEKIIVELKNKVGLNSQQSQNSIQSSDVYEALLSLGYSAVEIRETLKVVDRNQKTEDQLKEALKLLSKA